MATTSLLKVLIVHKYDGSINQHFCKSAEWKIHSTAWRQYEDKWQDHQIYIKEALLISKLNPSNNMQHSSFNQVLKLHSGNSYFKNTAESRIFQSRKQKDMRISNQL